MQENEQSEAARPTKSNRKGNLLLLGAIGLVLIPVVVGWVIANRDSGADANIGQSGMGQTSAAATDDATRFPIRPIDEILVGDFFVEVDDSGTSAVLSLDTTIDVVCSVVFGPTTQFGGLATDTDMAGGGHSNHHPLMAGLEPGTTVLYRVQGTAADGTIYVGEVEQFTTPAGDGVASRSNLSLDATDVETSSDFSAGFAGANAIDGSLSTEWSSRGDGDDAYIVIDLGVPMEITGIGFRTREMSDGTSITNSYTVSVDGGETLGPFEAGIGLVVSDFTATGQVLRIEMNTTTGGNTGAVEIEIYGQ